MEVYFKQHHFIVYTDNNVFTNTVTAPHISFCTKWSVTKQTPFVAKLYTVHRYCNRSDTVEEIHNITTSLFLSYSVKSLYITIFLFHRFFKTICKNIYNVYENHNGLHSTVQCLEIKTNEVAFRRI